jgi:hypothetical protein
LSQIGWAIAALLLAVVLGWLYRVRAARLGTFRRHPAGHVTLEDMGELISELTPTLRQTAMVTAPQSPVDRGHIWSSPCGKRVYIN